MNIEVINGYYLLKLLFVKILKGLLVDPSNFSFFEIEKNVSAQISIDSVR